MKFSALFQKNHILFDQKIKNTKELLSLASRTLSIHTSLDAHEIEAALSHRESLGPTCIGNQTMVPHAHLEKLEDCIIGYIRIEKPLLLECGETVKHVFFFISSSSLITIHLNILKAIAEIVTRHLDQLERCETAEEFIETIENTKIKIETNLVAKDFMHQVPSIRAEDTLSKAVDMMREQNWSHVPVTDNNGKFIGTVDFLDILATSMPDYVLRLSDLSFLSEFTPVKQFIQKEKELTVKPYIKHINTMIVPEDVSYVEVIFLMIKHKHRYLVTIDNDNNFKGVIRTVDVVNQIFRA